MITSLDVGDRGPLVHGAGVLAACASFGATNIPTPDSPTTNEHGTSYTVRLDSGWTIYVTANEACSVATWCPLVRSARGTWEVGPGTFTQVAPDA